MVQYVDWEEYSSLYYIIKDEQDFNKYEQIARNKIDLATFNRVKKFVANYNLDTSTDFQQFQMLKIKDTMYSLINELFISNNTETKNNVTSVSNDGYSETYSIKTDEEKQNTLTNIIVLGLAGANFNPYVVGGF